MLTLAFWRASSSYIVVPAPEELSGQEVLIRGRLAAEPLLLQSGQARFLNDMEISEASLRGAPVPVSKMRLFTDTQLSPGQGI